MSLSSGFYNSLNQDRKYFSTDFSRLIDCLIVDGIFQHIGTCFVVEATEGLTVNVGIGLCWFNHSWTYNDAILPIEAPESELVLDRIDALVLESNGELSVRGNTIKFIQGTPSSDPQEPELVHSLLVDQRPLCYIYRTAESTEITQADITNMVGTDATPFVSGILETVSLDLLLGQWRAQLNQFTTNQQAIFTTWFNYMKDQLSEDAAGNLQLQIGVLDELGIPDVTNLVEAIKYLDGKEVAVVDPLLATEEGFAADAKLTGDTLKDFQTSLELRISSMEDKLATYNPAVYLNGTYAFSIAHSTTTSYVVTFSKAFNSVPTVQAAVSNADSNITYQGIKSRTQTGFTFSVKANFSSGYARSYNLTWNASAPAFG